MDFLSKTHSSFTFPILVVLHICTVTFAATDTISRIQPLSGDTTVVSKEGKFQLGFFSPGNNENFYVGIWFRSISKRTVIWVANRDKPVSSATSPELKISEDGNLVLLNSLGAPIWSSNSTRKLNSSTIAVLLDNGNLILRDQDNSSDVFWQSFDHPTDTVLSGQWFGIDKITGEYQNRVSWNDPEDPASGPFSFHVDQITLNQYVSLWNHSKVYWQSGNWTGKAFASIPGMSLNSNYSYDFVNNSRELKFRCTTKDVSIITRIILSVNGQLQRHTWSHDSEEWVVQWYIPQALCDVYSVCGPFGVCKTGAAEKQCFCLPGFRPASLRSWDLGAWSQGCVRQIDIQCVDANKPRDKKEDDAFLKITNIEISRNPIPLKVRTMEECRSICLSNCTCTAYAHEHDCNIWNGELRDLKQLSDGNTDGFDIYIRLSASDPLIQDSEKKAHHVRLTVLIVVLGSIVVALCAIWVIVQMFQRRISSQKAFSNDYSLIVYDYSFLQHCTKNFSDKLGQGSFGSVFKGLLPDSKLIAVKKLQGMRQGEKQFQTEVRALGRIHHTNLVHLTGFCLRGAERLLVYDFMVNGSLDSHLFKNVKILDWNTRFQVILGVAKGLHYLHDECHDRIIHCDIKPENILLDADFSPKVADFGLAKLMDRNYSRALTTMRGTIGYLAPEWIGGLPITPKADVYSYGMMLFEIISGRRNTELMENRTTSYFPVWAAVKISSGDTSEILDSRLHDANFQELERACKVACWCIQDNEAHRPTMRQIVQILQGTQDVSLAPVPVFLQRLVEGEYENDIPESRG
ncbi:G-type lectin S-receptor-like serine/threonine-protein kinase At2g19130 isoform X2 [Phragmites australis]|uniref:G-type lectin S-receptor-like serine/threonine-protein kinase At2g19130 isoform X2 n=1 Tax=Phragmites australis TaxID=29695 RepID=UPI002D779B1C|nr:G-type lectin S-receptor-like serine/threonine-protein kinase At2g19130 isoform X2 [Phragmites australis]